MTWHIKRSFNQVTGLEHTHVRIEMSPHYNAEIIYIHWDYLNIRRYYFLCIRPPLPPFLCLHFSVPAPFYFLGIGWFQKFFSRFFVVVKYTNNLLDSVMCTFTLCMQEKKTNKQTSTAKKKTKNCSMILNGCSFLGRYKKGGHKALKIREWSLIHITHFDIENGDQLHQTRAHTHTLNPGNFPPLNI